MSDRNAVLRNQAITLTARFLNAKNELTDPADLKISIYPPGYIIEENPSSEDALVFEASLVAGGSGPNSDPLVLINRLSQGLYSFSFLVPLNGEVGIYSDYWKGLVDQGETSAFFNFNVVSGGSVGSGFFEDTQLYSNNIVFIELLKFIKAEDGSGLSEENTFYFTTAYSPLYVGVRRIRLDLGPFITDVIDDTINFAIFEASLNADSQIFTLSGTNANYLNFAKTEYVACLAELTLVRALLGDGNLSQKMYKSLGDLSVSRGGMLPALQKKLDDLEDCVARWLVVLQSGGDLTPDTSLRPKYSVKGMLAEDAITVNRQWESTSGVGYVPGANTSRETKVSRRRLRTFRKRT